MRGLTPPEDRRGGFLAALELGVSPVVPGRVLEPPEPPRDPRKYDASLVKAGKCGFVSPDPGDGYCACIRPADHSGGHACLHGGWH